MTCGWSGFSCAFFPDESGCEVHFLRHPVDKSVVRFNQCAICDGCLLDSRMHIIRVLSSTWAYRAASTDPVSICLIINIQQSKNMPSVMQTVYEVELSRCLWHRSLCTWKELLVRVIINAWECCEFFCWLPFFVCEQESTFSPLLLLSILVNFSSPFLMEANPTYHTICSTRCLDDS